MPTLYDIYKAQNKSLPTTADARFADPMFAQAAKTAGIDKTAYAVSPSNAGLNTRIASAYGKPAPQATIPTAPVAPVTTLPTPAKTNFTFDTNESPADRDLRLFNESQDKINQGKINNPTSDDQIRADALAQMQAEINAQNAVYADKLARAQVEGKARLGSEGAIQARRGLLGSDFGTAQTAGVTGANEAIYGSIENEKQAAVQSLLSKGRDMGQKAIAEKRASIEAGLAGHLEFLKGNVERSKNKAIDIAKHILAGTLTYDQYDPASIEQTASNAGVSVNQIKSAYNEQKKLKDAEALKAQTTNLESVKTQAEINKINSDIVKGVRDANKPIEVGGYIYKPDGQGNWVNSGVKVSATKAGNGTGLTGVPADIQAAAQSIFDGKSKLNEYPSEKRLQINQAFSKLYSATGGNELAQGAYDAITNLETHPGFSGAVGTNLLLGYGKNIAGSDSAGFLSELDKLKANIKLINIKYLKGTGAISDAEGATLENAGTSLNPEIPESDFTKELTRVKNVLLKSNNISTGDVTPPGNPLIEGAKAKYGITY